jgi:hypothetical protein
MRVRRDFSQSDPQIDAFWLRIGERLAGFWVIDQITTAGAASDGRVAMGFRTGDQTAVARSMSGKLPGTGEPGRNTNSDAMRSCNPLQTLCVDLPAFSAPSVNSEVKWNGAAARAFAISRQAVQRRQIRLAWRLPPFHFPAWSTAGQ